MRIPMKVDYGVRALVELAMRYGDGPVPAAAIAYRQGIPEPYLERLMSTLNKSGFVHSRRGPQGGHLLARPPRTSTCTTLCRSWTATPPPWTA